MIEKERRDLAWVPRWSPLRVIRRQSVAEHSYFVACYGVWIMDQIGWPQSGDPNRFELVKYLLRHDEDESLTGDVPRPTKIAGGYLSSGMRKYAEKRFQEPMSEIGPRFKAIRKLADLMDECLYLAGEINLGNRSVQKVLVELWPQVCNAIADLPCDRDRKLYLTELIRQRIHEEEGYRKDMADLMALSLPTNDKTRQESPDGSEKAIGS